MNTIPFIFICNVPGILCMTFYTVIDIPCLIVFGGGTDGTFIVVIIIIIIIILVSVTYAVLWGLDDLRSIPFKGSDVSLR